MPHFAASDLVLHCLPMFHKKDARLIWVKQGAKFDTNPATLMVSELLLFQR